MKEKKSVFLSIKGHTSAVHTSSSGEVPPPLAETPKPISFEEMEDKMNLEDDGVPHAPPTDEEMGLLHTELLILDKRVTALAAYNDGVKKRFLDAEKRTSDSLSKATATMGLKVEVVASQAKAQFASIRSELGQARQEIDSQKAALACQYGWLSEAQRVLSNKVEMEHQGFQDLFAGEMTKFEGIRSRERYLWLLIFSTWLLVVGDLLFHAV